MAVYPAVEVIGADSAEATIRAIPKEARKAMRDWHPKAAKVVQKFWRLSASGPAGPNRLGKNTGDFVRRIRVARAGEMASRIGTDRPDAAAHEFGLNKKVWVRKHRVREHAVSPIIGDPYTRREHTRKGHFMRMRMPPRPTRAPGVALSWPIIEKMAAGDMEGAMEASLRLGKRVRKAQKSALQRIIAAGGSGRRTR